ncbi:endo-1,4-beta-xylanase [Persicobacter psychrovividus]|uniref:endo-1,4-beta-xylanase n=1 Tax=Persicobacter psychrovividus TaxID=387638 RepID=A0ABM7VJB4_9BACT|nr:hypothetical protein PEPS_33620 [Persicobacter psychrovividus]
MKKLFLLFTAMAFFPFLGMAQDWETEANERINQHRKTMLTIKTLNVPTDGETSLRVKLKKHHFRWGTTVNINQVKSLEARGYALGSDHPYFNHFMNFNSVTVENTGKWKGWRNEVNRALYGRVRAWFMERGIDNRGHGTIWESTRFNAVPNDVLAMEDPEEIRQSIYDHIEDQMAELQHEIYEIDLVNEPVNEVKIVKDLLKLSEEDYAKERAEWYKFAREKAPDLKLVINEYNLIQSGNDFHLQFGEYLNAYIDAGGPVDVIGMQGHFWSSMPAAEELLKRLSEVAVHGIPMHVTEFDMKESSYEEMERIMTVCFAEPLMEGFTIWGAWSGNQWRNNGPIYKADWELKESGKAYFDLVHDKWSTDLAFEDGVADEYQLRVFKGDYDIILEHEGKVKVYRLDEVIDGGQITVDFAEVSELKPSVNFSSVPAERYCVDTDMTISAATGGATAAKVRLFVNGYLYAEEVNTADEANFSPTFNWLAQSAGDYEFQFEVESASGILNRSEVHQCQVLNNNIENSFSVPAEKQGMLLTSEEVFEIELDWAAVHRVEKLSVYDHEGNLLEPAYGANEAISVDPAGRFGNNRYVLVGENDYGCTVSELLLFTLLKEGETENHIELQIHHQNHDVEEKLTGGIDMLGDLDIGENIVGLYFEHFGLPHGAVVDSAFIQFSNDRDDRPGSSIINIYADNSAEPVDTHRNPYLSKRPATETVVQWDIPYWDKAQDRLPEQRTPNIGPIIQELIDNKGRKPYSPFVFILNPEEGAAKRAATSYDLFPSRAPSLSIYFHVVSFENTFVPQNLRYEQLAEDEYKIQWNNISDGNFTGYDLYLNDEQWNDSLLQVNEAVLKVQVSDYPLMLTATSSNIYGQSSDFSEVLTIEDPRPPLVADENLFGLISPNPVQDQCEILLEVPVAYVLMVDAMGRSHKRTVMDQQLQCADLNSGIYRLMLYKADHTFIGKVNILKQ